MIDIKELGRRIRRARKASGLSTYDVGEMLGYTHVAVVDWEGGKRKIAFDDLWRVAKITGRELTFFLDEPKPLETPETSFLRRNIGEILGVRLIPLVGIVRAGQSIKAVENIQGQIPIPSFLIGKGERIFAVRVKGDSMLEAGIGDDDIVILREQDYLDFPGQIAMVFAGSQDGVLAKVDTTEGMTVVAVYVGLFKAAPKQGVRV